MSSNLISDILRINNGLDLSIVYRVRDAISLCSVCSRVIRETENPARVLFSPTTWPYTR
jgi:hypothetical protein